MSCCGNMCCAGSPVQFETASLAAQSRQSGLESVLGKRFETRRLIPSSHQFESHPDQEIHNPSIEGATSGLRFAAAPHVEYRTSTTMRNTLFSVLLLAALPLTAVAEVTCTDRPECWPEGSSMRTGLVLVQRQNAVQARLSSKHEELLKLVSSSASGESRMDARLLAALKTQQAAWLKYRTDECELVGTLTGAGGAWPSTYAIRCEVNHTEQRLRRVRSAIRCIEKMPNEKRLVEQNNCLQQLAPLTNK